MSKNTYYDNWFTIHAAAFKGNYNILLDELNNGVCVNSIMYDVKFEYNKILNLQVIEWLNNVTPLYLAALMGNSRCVKLLMARGADPKIITYNTFSKKSYNAFSIALWNFNFNCYRLMKQKNNIKFISSSKNSNIAYTEHNTDQTANNVFEQVLLD